MSRFSPLKYCIPFLYLALSLGCTTTPSTEKQTEKTTSLDSGIETKQESIPEKTTETKQESIPEKTTETKQESIPEKITETKQESIPEKITETTPDGTSPTTSVAWTQSFGSSQDDFSAGMVVDSLGNPIVVGSFSDTLQVGTTTLTSKGQSDAFVVKTDSTGTPLWALSFGTGGNDSAISVTVDKQDNLYVVGSVNGAVTLGTFSTTNVGKDDVLVAKMDSKGVVLWVKTFGSTGDDGAYQVAMTPSGNIVITGYYEDSMTVGTTTLTSEGETDAFVIQLDDKGTVLWAKSFGGAVSDYGNAVAVDSKDNVYVLGLYAEELSAGTFTLNSIDDYNDLFLIKLDKTGTVLWVKSFGSDDDDDGYALRIDSQDSVLVSGYFSGNMSVNNSTLSSNGETDFFVLKLDSSGTVLWSKSFGGTSDDFSLSLAVSKKDEYFVAGGFSGSISFSTNTITSKGQDDIFLVKLDSSGNVLSAFSLGGTENEYANWLTVGTNGNLYMTGSFQGTLQIGSQTFTSKGGEDLFFLQFNP